MNYEYEYYDAANPEAFGVVCEGDEYSVKGMGGSWIEVTSETLHSITRNPSPACNWRRKKPIAPVEKSSLAEEWFSEYVKHGAELGEVTTVLGPRKHAGEHALTFLSQRNDDKAREVLDVVGKIRALRKVIQFMDYPCAGWTQADIEPFLVNLEFICTLPVKAKSFAPPADSVQKMMEGLVSIGEQKQGIKHASPSQQEAVVEKEVGADASFKIAYLCAECGHSIGHHHEIAGHKSCENHKCKCTGFKQQPQPSAESDSPIHLGDTSTKCNVCSSFMHRTEDCPALTLLRQPSTQSSDNGFEKLFNVMEGTYDLNPKEYSRAIWNAAIVHANTQKKDDELARLEKVLRATEVKNFSYFDGVYAISTCGNSYYGTTLREALDNYEAGRKDSI